MSGIIIRSETFWLTQVEEIADLPRRGKRAVTGNGYHYFDYIIMNPPFSDGINHLLKAWKISNGSATIKCLLNASSIDGYDKPAQLPLYSTPSKKDQLHHIIREYGNVEYLGQPFKNGPARRTTNVEVALVTLIDTRCKESFRLDFEPETISTHYKINELKDVSLAPSDAFDSFEAQYNATIEAFKRLLIARQEVRYYMSGLEPEHSYTDLVAEAMKKSTSDDSYAEFINDFTKSAWDSLFKKTKLSSVTTNGVRREIEKHQSAQSRMSFTAANMNELFYTLAINQDNIMLQCILEVFDELTKHYKENRVYIEGWKTNSSYFIPKKFILPHVGSNWGEGLSYERTQNIDDIERALCFLSGQKFDTITKITELYNQKSHYGEKIESTFFKTQLFLKGTMHFWWLDEDLRHRFNATVAKERWGWLPEKIKVGTFD